MKFKHSLLLFLYVSSPLIVDGDTRMLTSFEKIEQSRDERRRHDKLIADQKQKREKYAQAFREPSTRPTSAPSYNCKFLHAPRTLHVARTTTTIPNFEWGGNNGSNQDILTTRNRCMLYPRCLLFSCCDKSLLLRVNGLFGRYETSNPFSCMFAQNCSYDKPLHERLEGIDFVENTINLEIVTQWLNKLPPTPPQVYRHLSSRKEFKVLYLVQGDYKKNLEESICSVGEFLFLSYKDKQAGDLFFPGSLFSHGRMALYVAGRLLEFHQGWIFDYFVFLDDDSDFLGKTPESFEFFLQEWRPAVGGPGCFEYPKDEVESTNGIDFIFIAYHREALEILHPWVLDFDVDCGWASQLLGTLESSLIYRNHMLTYKNFLVYNGKHREYNKKCMGADQGFQLAINSHVAALAPSLRHCSITNVSALEPGGSLFQGSKNGKAQKKRHMHGGYHYHLMNAVVPAQFDNPCHDGRFNPSSVHCCTIADFAASIANP